VATGEGEEALRLLLRRLTGLDPSRDAAPPGFIARAGGGRSDELLRNPEAPFVEMDRLPSFLDLSDEVGEPSSGMLRLQTGRGCTFRCAYCQYNAVPRRLRSLSSLREELARFARRGGGTVTVLDATVNQEPGRLGALLEAIAEHPGMTMQGAELVVEQLDEHAIPLLARLYRNRVAIGLRPPTRPR
jgi:radical SAM superfamily enzyme YgiQ (UPF0313 family)